MNFQHPELTPKPIEDKKLSSQLSEKDLFPPLSNEDIKRVQEAYEGDGEVVSAFKYNLKKHDLRTLQNTSWLNDEVNSTNIDYQFLWRTVHGKSTSRTKQISSDPYL